MRQKVLARRFWSRTAAMMVAMISWGDGGNQEDADGVKEGVPEEPVLQHLSEVLESHKLSLAFEQVPVEEGDEERVAQGERGPPRQTG